MVAVARPWARRNIGEQRLWGWMPYEGGSNRRWLLEELSARIRPEWNKPARRWEIARKRLWVLTGALAERFGKVDVCLQFSTSERCDICCQQAQGDGCTCSCMGEHHGGAAYRRNWLLVGDTSLVSGVRRERHLRIQARPRTSP
ncbi:hypothetical protein [Streptomyces yunnanensis]|uniref:Uncharacterized protein n=1 Tax=Streptomyces yunnanensis TaxID=156453 RepID=A0A9X8N326_9ACTN|nr:hypothetical protein [Streptomyces yunnanensis]SHM80149.1 hypothetical protein SAMN05216268_114177 [Streptomyces yunnanensis]